MDNPERRQLERFNLEVPARLEFAAPHKGGQVITLKTSNICAGGAFFRTPEAQSEGAEVSVEIELPIGAMKRIQGQKNLLIRASGRVLRVDSRGMAVGFEEGCEILPMSS